MPIELTALTASSGRPTLQEAKLRDQRILSSARDIFLRDGYGVASLEAIARAAGTAKKTVYRQFGDKAALFRAVVLGLAEDWAREVGALGQTEPSLDSVLRKLALRMLEASVRPDSVALFRAVVAAAPHFPDLARSWDEAFKRSMAPLIDRLACEHEAGRISLGDTSPALAAEQFVAVTALMPRQCALLCRQQPDEPEKAHLADSAVALFLRGYQSSTPGSRA